MVTQFLNRHVNICQRTYNVEHAAVPVTVGVSKTIFYDNAHRKTQTQGEKKTPLLLLTGN